MSFGVLALFVLAGLAGPLLASGRRAFIPAVLGEVLAGVVVGRGGIKAIDPTNPTVSFLSDIGFAMLMFMVGTHVPLRDPRLLPCLRRGLVAAVVVGALAPIGALAVGVASGADHLALYAVVIASGSAAVVLPMVDEARLTGRPVTVLIAQITIADVATILAVPLVLSPSKAGRAALGGLAVVACAFGVISWRAR